MSNIVTQERIVSGVFIRNPFFKRYFDVYDNNKGHVYDVKERKGFFGIVHGLLNSKKRIDDLIEFLKEDNASGYQLDSIRNPFYFTRVERTTTYHSDDIIIKSWGFNYVDERVGGHCVLEKTVIFKKLNGSMKKIFDGFTHANNGYVMTYKSRIEAFLKTGNIC